MPSRAFHRRRRNAARLALYGSLLVVTALGLVLSPLFRRAIALSMDQSWADIDWQAREEVRLLQRLLQIDTTAETGSELEAAQFLAAELEKVGIETHLDRMEDERTNLWAVLEGESPRAIVLHNHLDTDPIRQPEAWKASPWSGKVAPPWIYGRGAFDMKSVTIAQLRAVQSVAREASETGRRPRRSIVFLATSSEEIGSKLGTRRILETQPELVSRFEAVLTEGGVIEAINRRQVKYWGTEFAQKRFVEVTARGERTRLEELVATIDERGQSSDHLRLVPEVRSFLEIYGPSRASLDHRILLAEPERLVREPGRYEQLPLYLKALFRDEIHSFPVEEDPAGGHRARIMLHLLPGSRLEEVQPRLLPEELVQGLDVTVDDPGGVASGSPVDHPVLETIARTLSEDYDVAHQGPYFLSFYATDSRFFRRAGIPSYGFNPFVILTTDSFTVTGPNERIALPAFAEGVELYVDLLYRLAGFETASEK